MIPKTHYYSCDSFTYITPRLFKAYHTQEEWETFNKWLTGQTVSEVNGEEAIYSWDYERWLRNGKKHEQGADWD